MKYINNNNIMAVIMRMGPVNANSPKPKGGSVAQMRMGPVQKKTPIKVVEVPKKIKPTKLEATTVQSEAPKITKWGGLPPLYIGALKKAGVDGIVGARKLNKDELLAIEGINEKAVDKIFA